MEITCAIADYFDVPNEWIRVHRAIDDLIWFTIKGTSTEYSAKLTRNKTKLKKNSIRVC